MIEHWKAGGQGDPYHRYVSVLNEELEFVGDVAIIKDVMLEDKWDEYANLIAAAPDLFEALVAAKQELELYLKSAVNNGDPTAIEVMGLIYAAISKAKGQT